MRWCCTSLSLILATVIFLPLSAQSHNNYEKASFLGEVFSKKATERPDFSGLDPRSTYEKGMEALKNKDYLTAAYAFDSFRVRFPSSSWRSNSLLLAGYAYYAGGYVNTARSILEKFTQFYPKSPFQDYALYLRILTYYNTLSYPDRNAQEIQNMMPLITQLIHDYPRSVYREKAVALQKNITDFLAGQEMMVGRFYEKRKDYLVASGRFLYVIQTYPQSNQMPEALYRLAECYNAMKLDKERQSVLATLRANYPQSSWNTTP